MLLWKQIRNKTLTVEFHRQVPIDRYVVDFYCHELMLAIEIDGRSHDGLKNDEERQARLEQLGVHFIRFADKTVRYDMNSVLIALADVIEKLKQK